jgi:hypothetical protein
MRLDDLIVVNRITALPTASGPTATSPAGTRFLRLRHAILRSIAAPPLRQDKHKRYGGWFLCGDNMAKRTARRIAKFPQKGSKASFKSIKKQTKQRTAAEKGATKMVAPASDAPTVTLTGRQARVEERYRELVAWYMLQGVDEATARRRAQDEIDDDPRKD